MHASDLPALKYIQSHLKTASKIFIHNDDFKVVIALIQHAHLVISMRHHPIIFGMSGGVPTVSVVFDDYFKHKNIGAMKLFGQERFVLREHEVESGLFEDAFKQIIADRDSISAEISRHTKEFQKSRGLIIKKYLQKYTRLKLNKI
jgi:polysaccharide pyruvyl transferase WcaK-like protein